MTASSNSMSIIATYGKTFSLKANAYKCKGYTFKGWSTVPVYKTVTYTDKQKITDNLSTKNKNIITLYAVWEKN